ncbi:hypothetical protein [Paenibacillus faecalis]|nr:hypothetical protein [Paenibacillus faecalis]
MNIFKKWFRVRTQRIAHNRSGAVSPKEQPIIQMCNIQHLSCISSYAAY